MASTKVKRRKVNFKALVKQADKNFKEDISVYEFKGKTFKEKQDKPYK